MTAEPKAREFARVLETEKLLMCVRLDYGVGAFLVTKYLHAEYFEIHAICPNARRVLDNPAAEKLQDHVFRSIAKELGFGPGWTAKAPSGSEWDTSLFFTAKYPAPVASFKL